jgi:hypothetical protein
LGSWRGTSLQMLSGARALTNVRIEARRQRGDLTGIEDCRSVEDFMTVNYAIRDSAPLRGLKNLKDLRLLASHPTPAHENIDISDIRAPGLRRLCGSLTPPGSRTSKRSPISRRSAKSG